MKAKVKYWMGVVSVFILGCTGNTIIPHKDMVLIIKQIYIADAVVSVSESGLANKDSIAYYEPILEKYGYTTAEFDSSIKYYAQHTEEFDEILDKVILELSKLQEQFDSDSLSVEDVDSTVKSDKNLWPHKTEWDMAIDHHSNPSLGFDIPVKNLGRYVISFDAQVFPDDQSEDTRMYLFFFYDDNTPDGHRSKDVYHTYIKDGKVHSLEFTLELDTTNVTHISGWLYDHGGERKDLKRHALFSNLKVNYKPNKPDSLIVPIKRKFTAKKIAPEKFKKHKKLIPAER